MFARSRQLIGCLQARRGPAAEPVVRRTGVHHAVPDPAGRQLHVPHRLLGGGGHAVVARAQRLRSLDRARRHRQTPQAPPPPPLPEAARRDPCHPRRVVERGRGEPPGAGQADRRPLQAVGGQQYQRPAGRPVPVLRERHGPRARGALQDVPAPGHQRRAYQRDVLVG
jgi:hypothetical protein